MNIKTLMMTAMTLMIITPAFAQSYSSDRTAGGVTEEKRAVSNRENVRVVLLDEDYDRGSARYVVSSWKDTADSIIGQPVYNVTGERIAAIDDVLVDQSGQVKTVVLAEGGLLGLGEKHTAFDYLMVKRREKDGEIIMPLNKKSIEDAPAFSYNTEDAGKANTEIMPSGNYRLSEILKADILSPQNNDIGNVDNATLQEGHIDYLVLSAGETLGIGGKQAAMPYSAVKMTGTGSSLDFKLTEVQTNRLDKFAKERVSSK